MARFKKIDDETISNIIELYEQGMKQIDISKELGITKSAVSKYVNKYKNEMNEAEDILRSVMEEENVEIKEKTESITDNVNHPAHYNKHNIECLQVVELFNFNRGSAMKYIWRAGEKDKNREIEDLKKAIFYIDREIERVKGVLK